MPLPSFLIVGPPKAGTTSIYRYLRSSSRVFVPSSKEPRFFNFCREEIEEEDPVNVNVIRSLSEYQKIYANTEDYSERGDTSPTYLYDKKVPRRVHKIIPNVKVIAVLRNPVERAFSHFLFAKQKEFEPKSATFQSAIKEDTVRVNNFVRKRPYVKIGFYWRHLDRWMSFFPRDQIKIMFFEDLKADETAFMRELFNYLEVTPDFDLQGKIRYAKSGEPRLQIIHRALSDSGPVARMFKEVVPESMMDAIRKFVDPFRTRLKNWNLEKPQLPDELYCELAEHYRADVERLEQEVERDLSHWLQPS